MKMLAERFIFPWNEIEANKTLYKGGMLLLHTFMPPTMMNFIAIKVP